MTIAAGSSTSTVSVQTTEDTLDEADETFVVNLSAPTNATLGSPDTATGTITDDDAEPTVSLGDATAVTEGDDPATTVDMEFPLTLDTVSGRDVTVTYTLSGTATAGSDYTDPATKTATIAAGSTTGNIVIPIKGDLVAEGSETVIVTLSGATNASVSSVSGEDTGTGTITDNDTAPTDGYAVGKPQFSKRGRLHHHADHGDSHPGRHARYLHRHYHCAGHRHYCRKDRRHCRIRYRLHRGHIALRPDHQRRAESSGEKTFSLTTTNDALSEGNETLTVHVTATGLTIADADITITDDDTSPTTANLSVSPSSVGEEDGATTVTVTATLDGSVTFTATTTVRVTVGKNGDTAVSDTDYTGVNAFDLTIDAGQSSGEKTFSLTPTNDTLSEGNETLTVHATATGLTISDTEITINDDDTSPTTASLSVSPNSVGEEDGATTVTVTATLDGNVTFTATTTVRVTVGKDGDTAVSDTDYTGVNAFDLTISAGQSSGEKTFSLTTTNDTLSEGNETLTVHATATGLTIADTQVTITDDDALPEITISDASVVEGGNAQFTVTLTPVSGRDVTVQWTTGDDTAQNAVQATADTDYTAQTTAATLTIAAGSTTGNVQVQTTHDLVAESDETFVVELASPTNATLGTANTATGTITDNDTGRKVSNNKVSIASNGVVIEGDWVHFSITLSEPLTEAAQIPIDIEFITADDYHCLQNNENMLCGSDVVPHKSMLGPEYAGILDHSEILRADKPWLVKMLAGDTSASGSIGTRNDDDSENERFRIVLDTSTIEWRNLNAQTGEPTFAEVIVVDKATYPVAGRWWAGLSQQARERMVASAAAGAHWENLLSQSVSKPFAKMRSENRAQAGALAGELVDAERSGADKVVDMSTPQAWWGSLDCRLRRIAVGEGVTADMDSLWCRDWPDGNASGRLTPEQTSAVANIFNAINLDAEAVGGPGQASPQNSEPQTMPVTAVSNVHAVVADAGSVTVTWDAVPQATSYTVEYTSVASDSLNALDAGRVSVAGIESGITGTTTTIRHGATESITITVTVTPAYVDGNGDTQLLNHLAGATTLEVVIAQPQQPQPECALPHDAITVAEVTGWRDENSAATHQSRWNRVLAALGEDTGEAAMTAEQSREIKSSINNSRWDRTTRTLEALRQCEGSTSADTEQIEPKIRVTAGSGVTEGGAATFVIAASPPPQTTLSVSVAITQSGDYGASAGARTVSIPTSGSYTLTVATTNDSVDEADGSVTATVNTGTGYTVSSTAGMATVSVSDDDVPEISIASDGDIDEGGSTTFTLTANPAPATDLSVSVAITQNGDYGVAVGTQTVTIPTIGRHTLTIPAGSTTGTLEVQTSADTLAEGDETIVVELASPTNATLGTAKTGIGTIADDDTASPTVSLSVSPSSVGEAAADTAITVTATLADSGAFTTDTTVRVTVGKDSDSAVLGTDYTGVSPFDLTIAAGESSGKKTFSLIPTNDALDEDYEKLTVHATAGSLTVSDAEVTITDDDALPKLTITDTSVSEGGKAMFTVTLTPVSGRDVSARWTTGYDPAPSATQATAGADYTTLTREQTLTIAAGSTTGTVEVQTVDDTLAEGDETFVVKLAYPANATLGAPKTATGAIVDDDTASPTVSLSVSPSSVSEAAADTTIKVTATLTGSDTDTTDTTVRVSFGKDSDSAVLGTDYTGVSPFDLTIAAGERSGERTFTLTPANDTLDEEDEKLTVHATAGSLTVSDAEVTITDDDALPELTISDASVSEGGKAMFIVTLTPMSGRDVTIQWTTGDDPAPNATQATANADYAARTAAATLTVATSDDSVNEPSGSVTVAVKGGTGYTVSPSNSAATVAVSDDDVPEISVSAGSGVTEGEDTTFTITGSPAPHAALPVSVSVTQSGDYGVATGSQTVTIPTGGSYTMTVTTTDDSADEADGSVTVTIDVGDGYTVSSSGAAATVAVSDDDDASSPPSCAPNLPSDAVTVDEVTGWRDEHSAATHQSRWNRVLAALGEDTGESPMTAEQAQEIKSQIDNSRWDRTARTLEAIERCDDSPPDPAPTPEISIAAGSSVTEGGDATFTITASPAPASDSVSERNGNRRAATTA